MWLHERLEFWSTLPRAELARRVEVEVKRKLTFAQTQLLSAAQERLRNWRAPIEKARRTNMHLDEESAKPEAKSEGKAEPAKKPAVKKPPAKKPAAKKPPAKKAKTKAKAAKPNGRIDPKAKITWAGKDNPFREGSGSYDRTELVRKASGKMAETILEIKGIKPTTLGTLKRMGLVRIEK